MTNSLRVSLTDKKAQLPTKGSEKSAGYDLYAARSCTISKGERQLVSTGIRMAIPHGSYGRVAPRSSLAVRSIDVGAGVIDSDYRGDVKVLLINNSKDNFTVNVGDRVAQLILESISSPPVIEVKYLDDTERGDGGFGSTGV